jgi:hypothetical protein
MDRSDKSRLGKLLVSYDGRIFGEKRLVFCVNGRGHGRRFCVLARTGQEPNGEEPF